MSAKRPAILCRGELQLRHSTYGWQTARISGRMTSEVVISHGTYCRGLLLVAFEYGTRFKSERIATFMRPLLEDKVDHVVLSVWMAG